MPENAWDETRIAELRSLSAAVDVAAADFVADPDLPTSAFAAHRVADATDAFFDALGERAGVMSLLDALESARRALYPLAMMGDAVQPLRRRS